MAEVLFDDDAVSRQWVESDEKGFTLRTRYKGTQEILDGNQVLRNEAPRTFREGGVEFHLAARIPMEVVEQEAIRLGRMPTAKELLELSQRRDYSKLQTRTPKRIIK